MTTVDLKDPDGDGLRLVLDERGIWVEVEEHAGGEPVRTVSAGPFPASAVRNGVDRVIHGDRAVERVVAQDRWAQVGVVVLLVPPAAGVLGLDAWAQVWVASFVLWALVQVWIGGRR